MRMLTEDAVRSHGLHRKGAYDAQADVRNFAQIWVEQLCSYLQATDAESDLITGMTKLRVKGIESALQQKKPDPGAYCV